MIRETRGSFIPVINFRWLTPDDFPVSYKIIVRARLERSCSKNVLKVKGMGQNQTPLQWLPSPHLQDVALESGGSPAL